MKCPTACPIIIFIDGKMRFLKYRTDIFYEEKTEFEVLAALIIDIEYETKNNENFINSKIILCSKTNVFALYEMKIKGFNDSNANGILQINSIVSLERISKFRVGFH